MVDTETACRFQRESGMAIWDEALPLLYRHMAEMPHRDVTHFDPDRDLYELMETNGRLLIYTARLEWRLIGYGAFIRSPSLWYRGECEVGCHSVYMVPEHRHGWAGLSFLRFIESELDQENPVVRHQHTHLGRREGVLFKRLGYKLVHEEWEKERIHRRSDHARHDTDHA